MIYFLFSCSPVQKIDQESIVYANDILKLKPSYNVLLFNTNVDVVGNHFSGLLLIKKMPDSSTRIVFSNEVGFKFFDFEFKNDFSFKVYSIVEQMNKKAVITTLQKDFELVLMQLNLNTSGTGFVKNGKLYFVFPDLAGKGYNCYITNMSRDSLVGMERRSSHNTFKFSIGLKRIVR
ncbi:MAG: hypothetical protein NTZ19_00810 [Bacteroidetes bacterium]|nr:hypothetical protein [Bacteroidota bacterium]